MNSTFAKRPESPADDDDISVVRMKGEPAQAFRTLEVPRIDDELLAMARGDVAAEAETDYVDPFGGLIPIFDDAEGPTRISMSPAAPPAAVYRAVLRLRLPVKELIQLPIDLRAGFLLSHFDGKRTVEDVIDLSQLCERDALDVIDDLLALGAIELA